MGMLASKRFCTWVNPTDFDEEEIKRPRLLKKKALFFAFAVGRYKAATSSVFLRKREGTCGKIVIKLPVSKKQQRRAPRYLGEVGGVIEKIEKPKAELTTVKRYFQLNQEYINEVEAPLKFFQTKYDIFVKVSGGGKKGQSKAIKLAISRAIIAYYQEIDKRWGQQIQERYKGKAVSYKRHLKCLGYLTQASRCKERKKYGLRKARKAPQFSKR